MKTIDIIDFYIASNPRRIWEMDKATYMECRNRKDDAGVYLWLPTPNHPEMTGTLMGAQISIASEKCFQLLFLYEDGHRHVVKFPGYS